MLTRPFGAAPVAQAGRAVLAVAAALAPLAACGAGGSDGTVTVFAAASLTDAFDELGAAFDEAHPGLSVELAYDGSSSLRDQILAGAPADVFAPADRASMDAVAATDGLAAGARVFATNRLAVVVPAGNPAGVDGLDAFGDGSLLLGLCAPEVPCGALARQALARAGVTPAPDTEEPDVRSLLDKVASGELDAGIVYATDVRAGGDAVEGVTIPEEQAAPAEYPVATLAATDDRAAADAFVAFVLSTEGRAILAAHGFGPPP